MKEKESHEKLDDLLDEFVNILYVMQEGEKEDKELIKKLQILMNEMTVLSKQIGGILRDHVLLLEKQLKKVLKHSEKVDSIIKDSIKIKNDLWPL